MDVKEFISDTLKQIIDGVKDAQAYATGKDAVVVPYYGNRQNIDFDIAVTVVEGKETGGKAGISVWSIGAGVSGKSESSSSTASRIKFEIPVELPKGSQSPPR
jgi:hypothetical protein